MTLYEMIWTILLLPCIAGITARMGSHRCNARIAHYITISSISIVFIFSCIVFNQVVLNAQPATVLDLFHFQVGSWHVHPEVLVDPLNVMMMVVLTFVSLFFHVYGIGYMKNAVGYARFFSNMTLFTLFLLVVLLANNFIVLFLGWEAAGIVAYSLASAGSDRQNIPQYFLKRMSTHCLGDIGFILAIGIMFWYVHALTYAAVFAAAPTLAHEIFPATSLTLTTVICLLIFIGAILKSVQVLLPALWKKQTRDAIPIAAFVCSVALLTAAVYLIARCSPLFEYSNLARAVLLVIGASIALLLACAALVQNNIKRIIAYSTFSQLGYMMVALGASAYAVAIFHSFTHTFFKALLFLSAGSVVIALHSEQDIRRMGGLYRYLPITYVMFLIGTLALTAIPPFAGFYSREMIITAAQISILPGATYAYICVLLGSFITALYAFRLLFLVFHGESSYVMHPNHSLHEHDWVIWFPLVVLAIPSLVGGALLVGPLLLDVSHWFGASLFVGPERTVMADLITEYKNADWMVVRCLSTLPFWFAVAGIMVAYVLYCMPCNYFNRIRKFPIPIQNQDTHL